MSNVLSVNEVIDRVHELDGMPVEIVGLLTFEFENYSLRHFPKAERREITEAVDPPFYQSSIWIAFGAGSIQPNQGVLTRWTGKRIRIAGVVRTPKRPCGCGHFGGWDVKSRLIRLNVSECLLRGDSSNSSNSQAPLPEQYAHQQTKLRPKTLTWALRAKRA